MSAPKKLRERVGGINFLSFKLFKSCTLGAKIGRCRKIKFYQINSLFFFFPSSFTYIWHLYYHNPNSFFYLSLLFYFGNGVCTIQFFFLLFLVMEKKNWAVAILTISLLKLLFPPFLITSFIFSLSYFLFFFLTNLFLFSQSKIILNNTPITNKLLFSQCLAKNSKSYLIFFFEKNSYLLKFCVYFSHLETSSLLGSTINVHRMCVNID